MISGDGRLELQKQQVAQVARDIFGTAFTPDQVINETLTRSFSNAPVPPSETLRAAVLAPIDSQLGPDSMTSYPTAIWLESRIALAEKEGQLVRNSPMTFGEITETLAADSGSATEDCEKHLVDLMHWIRLVNERNQDSRYTYLESPLLFDPTSGQFFSAQTSEGTKLTRLGSEGRSTSTTITAFSILSRLAEHGSC